MRDGSLYRPADFPGSLQKRHQLRRWQPAQKASKCLPKALRQRLMVSMGLEGFRTRGHARDDYRTHFGVGYRFRSSRLEKLSLDGVG